MRTRLAAVSTIVATIGLGVAGTAAYVVTSRTLNDQIDASLHTAPLSIDRRGPDRAAPSRFDLCDMITDPQAPSPGLYDLQLVRADGSYCAEAGAPRVALVPADFEAARTAGVSILRDGRFDDGRPARVAVVSHDDGQAMVIARDTSSVVNVLNTLKATLFGVVVLGAMIALLLSRWIAGAGLRPITRFARVAEEIAETGRLDRHVSPRVPGPKEGQPGGDELDRLAHAFNKMTAVLNDAQQRQRRLVADAGHELRTPLSSLGANISLLRRSRAQGRPLPPGEEEPLLADLSSQVAELATLVDDLVALSADEDALPGDEPVRLDQVVERAVRRARRRTSGHVFDVRLEPWVVHGDEVGLERAVVNLLDNAVKFSPGDSEIAVRLHDGRLTVADRGPGIAQDDADRAFERFWRSPAARALPGSGLGLAIVGDVVERHGGRAALANRPGGGAVAAITLPGTPPAAVPSDARSDGSH